MALPLEAARPSARRYTVRYRKKPVVVEVRGPIEFTEDIVTLEGVMRADVGDYIITGVKGEHYPCKPDIFHATYEPAHQQGETR